MSDAQDQFAAMSHTDAMMIMAAEEMARMRRALESIELGAVMMLEITPPGAMRKYVEEVERVAKIGLERPKHG